MGSEMCIRDSTGILVYLFRFIILLGVSYIVLYPFFTKIAASFMSPDDFIDVTVMLIPKYPTFDQYKAIFIENNYVSAFFNTLFLSASSAILQTFVACLVGYGLAKFKFKGNNLVMAAVILTMVVPHGTVYLSMFMQFRYFDLFDFFGIFEGLGYKGIIQAGTEENPYYTNSSQLPVGFTDDPFEALDLQSNLQTKYTGGTVLHLYMGQRISSAKVCRDIVRKVLTNYRLPYVTITPTFSICPKHGYISGEHKYCPICDEEKKAEKRAAASRKEVA